MNENNNKLMQLIYALMTADSYMNIEQMSKAISMSQRTINNYLKQIRTDSELSDIFVLKKSAYGIRLNVVNSEKYEALKDKLELSISHTRGGNSKSSNAIIIELLLHLLDADDYIRIGDLADRFYYSTGSVNKYLKDIRIILQAYRLDLTDKPYHGIKVTGDEVMIRHLYGDLIEYEHNNEGITNETTSYSKYYSTSNDDRNRLKVHVIESVTSYLMPISNGLLKTTYKYVELSHARFTAGYRVTLSEGEKQFIGRFYALRMAREILERVYPGDDILQDENEVFCLARRIIVGFGNEVTVEKCPDAGSELIDKAAHLANKTLQYLDASEHISFKGREQYVRDYLTNTYLSILISDELSDCLSFLSMLLKDEIIIKGQLSYSLAYKISRFMVDYCGLHMSDKSVVLLSLALHYVFITAQADHKKMDIVLSTEYLPEENEVIRYKLLQKDQYGCINKIDIQYLYEVSQSYFYYDLAIFDFPRAYLKGYPLKTIYISDIYNYLDVERVYRDILYYSTDFRKVLETHGLTRIGLYNVNVSIPNLIGKLFAGNLSDQTPILSDMVNDMFNNHMLIQNGVLIIMNKTESQNSFDIYRTNAMVVRDSKTYVDTVCFINYCFDDSQVFIKIMELLAYNIVGIIEFIESKKMSVIDTDDIAEYINRLYIY